MPTKRPLYLITVTSFLVSVVFAQNPQTFPITEVPSAYKRGDDGKFHIVTNVDLVALWPGVLKDDTNGVRVQLVPFADPTDKYVRIGVGTVVSNGLGGFVGPPNSNFNRFELQDSSGGVVPFVKGANIQDHLPSRIFINDLPRWNGGILNNIGFLYINFGPSTLRDVKINDFYKITKEGDYKLTVCPAIYKWATNGFLDRIDLPCVTTTVHLAPVAHLSSQQ
jgi:hypothetical protein